MADYLVGARFLCLACRERGIHPACAGCGATTLDLAEPADRSTLAARWSGARAFEAGLGLWSLRNLLLASRLRRATLIMTVVVIVGAGASAALGGRLQSPAEVAGVVVGIAITGPLFAPLLGLFLLVYANVVRILGLLIEIFMPVASAAVPGVLRGSVRGRFNLVRTLLWWIESALLPRIDLSPSPVVAGVEESGTLIAPLTLSIVVDESGWLWCCDAIVPPFVLRTSQDQLLEVTLDVGAVTIPLRLGERVTTPGETAQWLSPPSRGNRFQRILPASTRVRFSGGERGEALRGTTRAPLLAVFGEAS